MIAERSNTAQEVIERLSPTAPKVGFFDPGTISRALLRLEEKGFPNNKVEDYKYCNVDAVLKREFGRIGQQFSDAGDITEYRLEDTITLVVLNGVYSEKLSDKVVLNGLRMDVLGGYESSTTRPGVAADVDSDSLIALNTAFCSGGFELTVRKDTHLQIPVHVLYINASGSRVLVNPRSLIRVEEGASLTLIEQVINAGKEKVFCNFLSEKFVAENAELDSYTIQDEGELSYSVNTNQVLVGRAGRYSNTTITLGGEFVRNNHNVVLKGENGEANLSGLFSASGAQLVDNHTLVDHQVPHCQSNELYKGIVSGKSTGVFNGKIYVRRDAQKTNAYQSSKNILLSDDATINTKPQLEIYANDVKCSHGTSTGKIDEDALFYLNARGIGQENARRLLLSSFAGEVISGIAVDSLRERITSAFESKLVL